MRIKTSELTIVLVIGLIVVTVAKAFYSPLHLIDIMENMEYPTYNGVKIPLFVFEGIMFLFMPIMATTIEFMPYILEFMNAINDQPSRLLAAEVLLISYFVIVYFLEKIHSGLHEEEEKFSLCVDMICIENISLYLYSIIIYHITQLIMQMEESSIILVLLIIPLLVVACVVMVIFFLYILVGILICSGPSLICFSLLQYKINEELLMFIMLALMVVFSQIVWRLVSDKIFNVILEKASFDHLSLD